MLTNNFYQVWRACMSQQTITSALVGLSGNTMSSCYHSYGMRDLFNFFANSAKAVYSPSSSSGGIAFGTGDTPPSPMDHYLSGELITTIRIVATTVKTSISDGVFTFENALTVSNSGNDSIVINEMAVIAYVYYSSNSYALAMVDRTVLDTPLTLAPGEQGVITYTFNLPIVQ